MVDKIHSNSSFDGILKKMISVHTIYHWKLWMHKKHDAKNGGEIVCISIQICGIVLMVPFPALLKA